jgi:hydroxyacylglutathione hydrolase
MGRRRTAQRRHDVRSAACALKCVNALNALNALIVTKNHPQQLPPFDIYSDFTMDHLSIHPIEAGPVATYGYLITDTKHGVAAVIDAPLGSADYFLEAAKAASTPIQAIVLTHAHFDHIGDVAALKRATNAPVYLHPDDEYRMAEPNKHISFALPFTIEGAAVEHHLHHGDQYSCGDWTFEIRHTPGHTEGGVCFVDHAHGIAFVGDTLFAGSIGRTDLAGGDTATLLASIRTQLYTLPDDMTILPGHGSSSTIGAERRSNPFVAG